MIMSGAFMLSFTLISVRDGDPYVLATGVMGVLASLGRLGLTRALRQRALTATLDRTEARKLELAFAVPFQAFSISLGAFAGHVFAMPDPEAHMLCTCLLVGYCAGVATGSGLRPLIAIPSMFAALLPTLAVSLARTDPMYFALGIIMAGFLFGGAQTVIARQTTVKLEVGKRLTFGSLALRDSLTALPNRLALNEYFAENFALMSPSDLVAVHYLDLDGFKPVNDRYGHATGDALLKLVAERLAGAVRNGDIAARLGGDEFAIVQPGLKRPEQAQLLVRRIRAAIGAPFEINGHTIHVSVCVGSVVTEMPSGDLESLLARADERLYAEKRARKFGHLAAA
ncbi:MAG: GGDEF domain-containing protein [Sphingomonadales bacterium 12-68-11]|nr:MAG: GGDEF domain-containing protein [Sphingomonadales bacterium 12-68-11]